MSNCLRLNIKEVDISVQRSKTGFGEELWMCWLKCSPLSLLSMSDYQTGYIFSLKTFHKMSKVKMICNSHFTLHIHIRIYICIKICTRVDKEYRYLGGRHRHLHRRTKPWLSPSFNVRLVQEPSQVCSEINAVQVWIIFANMKIFPVFLFLVFHCKCS